MTIEEERSDLKRIIIQATSSTYPGVVEVYGFPAYALAFGFATRRPWDDDNANARVVVSYDDLPKFRALINELCDVAEKSIQRR